MVQTNMEITEQTISAAEKAQAEKFFKVLVSKRYDVAQMADILGHMGKMLVGLAESLDKDRTLN